MQNRYVGDIGDFGKYGLLRQLTSAGGLSLAVLWYLYPDEGHNSDGRHVSYLSRPGFRDLDPDLYDRLRQIVSFYGRSVEAVERSGILPGNTIFFSSVLAWEGRRSLERKQLRDDWLTDAVATAKLADLVFFDPDNGLQTPSVSKHAPKSGKYVFWSELEEFWNRGHSLVVYHHLNRTAPVIRQTDRLRHTFMERFPSAQVLVPLLFRRGSCRHFWVIGQPQHSDELTCQLEAFLRSGWNLHFTAA